MFPKVWAPRLLWKMLKNDTHGKCCRMRACVTSCPLHANMCSSIADGLMLSCPLVVGTSWHACKKCVGQQTRIVFTLYVFTRRSKGSQTLLPLLSSPKFINKPNCAPESSRPLLADLGRDLCTLTSQDMGVKYAASREVLGRGKKDDSIH